MGGDKNRFLPYVAALKNLDTLLEQYSRGDLFGLAPALTEEDRQRLMQSILAAANAGEAFLADAENRNALNEEAPLLAERMQALLSTDYAALNAYDPARGLSLPEIQEEARTLTVDFRGKKLEVKSGLSAARIPMTVVDADGTKRRGFFSKARYVDITAEYQKAIEKAKALCNDKGQQALDILLGKIKTNISALRGYEETANRDDLALATAALQGPAQNRGSPGLRLPLRQRGPTRGKYVLQGAEGSGQGPAAGRRGGGKPCQKAAGGRPAASGLCQQAQGPAGPASGRSLIRS